MFTGIFTSLGGWAGILAGVVEFGNQLVPVLPPAWSHLLAAILGIIALYKHGQVVSAGRAAGVKGV